MAARSLAFGALAALTLVRFGLGASADAVAAHLDRDEIAVMAAALKAAYAASTDGWVLVGARTATFACNPPEDIGLKIGGCSGMRMETETPAKRLQTVHRDIPQVTPEIVADFLEKNQRSTTITEPLPVPIPQTIWAPGSPLAGGHSNNPVFAAYFSRVGFNRDRTNALLYFATVSWTDARQSVGQYLYLERAAGSWVVKGHSSVWQLLARRHPISTLSSVRIGVGPDRFVPYLTWHSPPAAVQQSN